jgi:hypothetical protein
VGDEAVDETHDVEAAKDRLGAVVAGTDGDAFVIGGAAHPA